MQEKTIEKRLYKRQNTKKKNCKKYEIKNTRKKIVKNTREINTRKKIVKIRGKKH